MAYDLTLFPREAVIAKTTEDILATNAVSERFGMRLSPEDAMELALARERALERYGRVEFGGGVIEKLAFAFCDSPYINDCDYAKALSEFVELFYAYKYETLERASDDELIEFMRESYNNACHGAAELLLGRELHEYARRLRGCDAHE